MNELSCGPGEAKCSGDPPKFISMCPVHQAETAADHTRRMGIPDLQYTSDMLVSVEGQAQFLRDIMHNLKARPTKSLLIRVIP